MRSLCRIALPFASLLVTPAALAQTYSLDRVIPANGMGRYLQASFYDPSGDTIAIVDFSGAYVHRYRIDGTFVGASAISPPFPSTVDGAALAPDGTVALLVTQGCEVFEVSPATLAVSTRRTLAGSGSIPAPSICSGIDVGSDGALYVASYGNNYVYVYPRTGTTPTRRFATPFAADNLAHIPGTSQLVVATNDGTLAIYNEDGSVVSGSSRLGGAVWRGTFTRVELDGATFIPTTGQFFFCHHGVPIDNCYLLSRTCESNSQCPSPYFASCDGGQCLRATCGDGRREGAEACDDGNTRDGDGCSARCTVEEDFRCIEPTTSLRNGSFEAPAISSAYATITPTDWTLAGGAVDIHHEGFDAREGLAPDGAQLVDLNGSSPGRIYQDVSTTPDAGYNLRFQLAYNSACATGATMRVSVLNGSTSTVSDTLTARHRLIDPVWSTQSLAFRASGTTTRIQFEGLTPSGACGAAIDAVSVTGSSSCTPIDTDGDGIPDAIERRLMLDPTRADTDGDGVPDGTEVPDPSMPRDTDGDGIIDGLDPDDDGDGIPTRDELGPGGAAMPRNSNATVPPGEGSANTIPDYLDPDDDGDGIPTRIERSLEGSIPGDSDSIPAYLDRDSDNDGVPDAIERGPDGRSPANSDMGGPDDRPDFLDTDSDNDCLPDSDPREAGAARTDATSPSRVANDNCSGATSVCDETRGICVAPPPSDASSDVFVDAADVEDVTVADVEDVTVADVEDVTVADVEDVTVADVEDVTVADVEDVTVADVEDVTVADVADVIDADVADVIDADVVDAATSDVTVVDAAVADAATSDTGDVVVVSDAAFADALDEDPSQIYQGAGCGCAVQNATTPRGASLLALAALAILRRRRR